MIRQVLIALSFLLFISCGSKVEPSEPWSVSDISQREERIALLMENQPSSFQLKLRGNTDGNYKVYLISGSRQQPNVTLNFAAGTIDTSITQAWVEPSCKVIYVPERVTAGQMDIELKLLSQK